MLLDDDEAGRRRDMAAAAKAQATACDVAVALGLDLLDMAEDGRGRALFACPFSDCQSAGFDHRAAPCGLRCSTSGQRWVCVCRRNSGDGIDLVWAVRPRDPFVVACAFVDASAGRASADGDDPAQGSLL